MTTTDTDRIEKKILLRAPRSRVWRALTDSDEFGSWFGVKLEEGFVAGKPMRGRITTPGYEHIEMKATVEQIVPETYFSFRWHPYALDPNIDYSLEPTTLIEFRLADADGGTLLTILESGFDAIPAERRAEAYRMNAQGWETQLENVRRHVAG